MKTRAALILLLLWAAGGAADETITRGGNLAIDVADDGRMAIDLVGELWTVPLGGGVAEKILEDAGGVTRPRWSPDSTQLVYATTINGTLTEFDANVEQEQCCLRDDLIGGRQGR